MKSIIITGASTGIGEAIAVHLAKQGYKVYAGYRKEADAEKLKLACGNIVPVKLDVCSAEEIENVRLLVEKNEKECIALINNAGIAVAAPLEGVPMEDFRKQLDINVHGLLMTTQAFIPILRKTKGTIIHIGSIAGKVSAPFLGPYSASKFAVEAISDALRMELRPWGIKVICVEPGSIQTPIWDKSLEASTDMENRISEDIKSLYQQQILTIRKMSKKIEARGIPAQKVAEVVEKIIKSSNPKARYVIGLDAKIQKILKWLLPDKWLDKILCKNLRLPY